MLVRPVQPENASLPMLVTLDGIAVVLQPAISVLLEVSIIALQLSLLSYFEFPASTLILVSPVQPEIIPFPILSTFDGMVMLVRPEQLEKAEEPMLVTLDGMVMLVRPEQLEKAEEPMLVTLDGMVMFVRPER